MFIYTVKASRLKFFALLICSMAIILTIAAVLPKEQNYESVAVVAYDYSGVKTNDDRIDFLKSFGYDIDPQPTEIATVVIPEHFDSIYTKYNDLQRSQGLNLKRYSGKEVKRYTYKITNYADGIDGTIANLLVYNGNVIGGDICRTKTDPFLHGFAMPENLKSIKEE